MARSRKKRRGNVYTTNFGRISVYPSFQRPKESTGKRRLAPGDIVKVRVSNLDDDGRPMGAYLGYTVIIEGYEAEPGVEVRVEITRVEGRTAWGRPLEQ